MTDRDRLRESFEQEMAGLARVPYMTLSQDEFVALYSNKPCCPSFQIDSVHDVSCPTTGSVYRCENCDLPFPRTDATTRFCLFCDTLLPEFSRHQLVQSGEPE